MSRQPGSIGAAQPGARAAARGEAKAPAGRRRAAVAFAVVLVLSVYAWIVRGAHQELGEDPKRAYYNLLVEGFRAGRLSLPLTPPAELERLPDPYDPAANERFRGPMFETGRVHDLSYYRGRLYLYFGVTPALLVFGPAILLFGAYLPHAAGVVIFSVLGFLVSAALVVSVWRRCFGSAPAWLGAAGVLGVGLGTALPLVLQRPEAWEVAITCGYALLMVTLFALWCALQGRRTAAWLVLASAAFGLALGARPSLILVAPILYVPVWCAARAPATAGRLNRRGVIRLFLAATIPVLLVGLGLLAYNVARFGSAAEFGQTYQLAGERQMRAHFAWSYFPENVRIYFLSFAHVVRHFPYWQLIPRAGVSVGHGDVEFPYGVLTGTPWVWLAVAAPLAAWRGGARPELRGWVAILLTVFAVNAVAIACYYGACVRYELEFTPALALLAVVGWFGLHAATSRRALRWILNSIAIAALAYSVGFTALYGWVQRSFLERNYAAMLLRLDRNREALATLEHAVRIAPDFGELHFMLGCALTRNGALDAGRGEVVRAIALNPKLSGYFVGFYGQELAQFAAEDGKLQQLRRFVEDRPDLADAHTLLGKALAESGHDDEAIGQFRAVLRLSPGNAEAHCSLGLLLARKGDLPRAVDALEAALALEPKLYDAHMVLGRIAAQVGQVAAARSHFEAAARLHPDAAAPREALQQLPR